MPVVYQQMREGSFIQLTCFSYGSYLFLWRKRHVEEEYFV
jgi:hypothetical protein